MTTSQKLELRKLSIILVNFKSKRYLEKCIASVYEKMASSPLELEIIVINNDSNEDINFLKNLFPKVNIWENFKNKGLANTWNLGRNFSDGELVCFLNPDTEILSENIEEVILEFEKDADLGVLGPKLIDQSGNIQEWSAGRRVSLMDLILNNLGIIRSRNIWRRNKKISADWVSGAAFFIRVDHFDLVKGFDENFFLYFEDVDFCQRMRMEGKKVLYFPDFVVKHFGGGSHDDSKKQKQTYYLSQDYYFQKHFGKLHSLILVALRRVFVRK